MRPKSDRRYIYLAETVDGMMKIGCTQAPIAKRICVLSNEMHVAMRVIRVIPGDFIAEKQLHVKFSHLLKMPREWYTWSEEILEYFFSQRPVRRRSILGQLCRHGGWNCSNCDPGILDDACPPRHHYRWHNIYDDMKTAKS